MADINWDRGPVPPSPWFAADYTACGPYQGIRGIARHVHGDWWEFNYLGRSALGGKIHKLKVFRTEIQLIQG